jgi:transposase
MDRPRRTFTKEFKEEAVQLVLSEGYTCAEAGRSLGLNPNLLSRWKQEVTAANGQAFPGHGQRFPDPQRIQELERQVRRLQMEKDVLKKAAAFFAKESA